MTRHLSVKLSDIPKTAKDISKKLKGGETLALIGPLGAGKTTFVKEIAKLLKIKHKVTSPTFVIFHHYRGKINKKPVYIFHFDLYRTKNFREIKALGIEEIWQQQNNVTFIEWADKIKTHLPKDAWIINFIK